MQIKVSVRLIGYVSHLPNAAVKRYNLDCYFLPNLQYKNRVGKVFERKFNAVSAKVSA
jgi:hypothetical protein